MDSTWGRNIPTLGYTTWPDDFVEPQPPDDQDPENQAGADQENEGVPASDDSESTDPGFNQNPQSRHPEPGTSQQKISHDEENGQIVNNDRSDNQEDDAHQEGADAASENRYVTERDSMNDSYIDPGPRGTEHVRNDEISDRVQGEAEPQPGPSKALEPGNKSRDNKQSQTGSQADDPGQALPKPQARDVKVRILPNIRITRRSKAQKEPIYRPIVKILNTRKDRTGREWVKILCQGDRPIYSYWVEKSSLTGSQFEAMIKHFMEMKNQRDKGFMSSMVQRVQTLFGM